MAEQESTGTEAAETGSTEAGTGTAAEGTQQPAGTQGAAQTETGSQTPAGEGTQASGSMISKAAEEGSKQKADNSEFVGSPEGYGVYTVPEGIQVDVGMVTELNDLAKKMNLSQAGAQKLVDLQVKMTQKQGDTAWAQFNEMKESWEKETRQELGVNYNSEMGLVRKTVQAFATPELLKLFDDTGIGNHKAMVAFMRKVGKTIAEDTAVAGSGAAGKRSSAEVLFGGST